MLASHWSTVSDADSPAWSACRQTSSVLEKDVRDGNLDLIECEKDDIVLSKLRGRLPKHVSGTPKGWPERIRVQKGTHIHKRTLLHARSLH